MASPYHLSDKLKPIYPFVIQVIDKLNMMIDLFSENAGFLSEMRDGFLEHISAYEDGKGFANQIYDQLITKIETENRKINPGNPNITTASFFGSQESLTVKLNEFKKWIEERQLSEQKLIDYRVK